MTNNIKTFFLMSVLTVLFVWIGGLLGGKTGSIIALIAAGAMNLYGFWFSDKMVLRQYRAVEVGSDDNSRLYSIVSKLANQNNLPMPRVLIIPEKNPNAFATGRDPKHAAVAATQGILDLLDDDELEGVMAHELAHVKHRDILTGTIAATFAGALAMLGQFARFGSASRGNRQRQNPVLMLLLIIGAPIAGMIIRSMISRTREFAADFGGSQICGKPIALANALHKLKYGVEKHPLVRGNPAHSHMFIVNPFLGGFQKLFTTHPPVEERIQKLELLSRPTS